MKTPTQKQKIIMYESFLHRINMCIISGNHGGITELVGNADNWSYSHRCGEFVTDKQRQKMINGAFWKLLETPNTDKETIIRQAAWEEMSKEKHKAFMKNA
jgi:hypothetical protein